MITKEFNKNKLYLVNLGGKIKGSHLEIHDLRWVVGNKIEDTFKQLRIEWFGNIKGLHIDSFVQINFIDGYKINILENLTPNNLNLHKSKSLHKEEKSNAKLWFVNLGAYDPNQLNEQHHFRLVVANNSQQAKKITKSKWINNNLYKHSDNIHSLNDLYTVDDCYPIQRINHWIIDLQKDELNRSQELIPDWFGYMRIDRT